MKGSVLSARFEVWCPPWLPRAVYVVECSPMPARPRCWLVPVTAAGAAVDWSRRREVPLPAAARLGSLAPAGGVLARGVCAAIMAEAA